MSQHGPGQDDSRAARPPTGLPGAADADEEETEGGEPACWAHLVCPECGAITSEGHRQGCALAPGAARRG